MSQRFGLVAAFSKPEASGLADEITAWLTERGQVVVPETDLTSNASHEVDAIVVLGGDGLMLQTLHRFINDKIAIYGMNRGSVGFLMNEYREENLRERLAAAEVTRIHPLAMIAQDAVGKVHKGLAINEVSLFRERYQAAKLRIEVDGKTRLDELICDGLLVATPEGGRGWLPEEAIAPLATLD